MYSRTVVLLASHASKGGILTYMESLRTRLEREGLSVIIVAFYRGSNGDHIPNCRILVQSERVGLFGYVIATLKLVGLCFKLRPNVIIGCMPFANIVASLLSKALHSTAVATHHNPIQTQHRLLQTLDSAVGKLGWYRRIICVSDAVANSFRLHSQSYRSSICIIRNGLPSLQARRSKSETRRLFNLNDDDVLLLMAGRLAPQKNVVSVVQAMRATRGLKLLLAGDGPQKDMLEQIIKMDRLESKVRLLGVLGKQDLVDLLYAVDVFVQVSLYEGHSLSLLEAIVARLPLVVSDVPSQIEAVTLPDGRVAAAICDPRDVISITNGIQTAAKDKVYRTKLIEKVEMLANSLRSENDILNDYVKLLREILSSDIRNN